MNFRGVPVLFPLSLLSPPYQVIHRLVYTDNVFYYVADGAAEEQADVEQRRLALNPDYVVS